MSAPGEEPPVEDVIRQLPPDLQAEVRDFARALLERHTRQAGGRLRMDWAGALRDLRGRYTSTRLERDSLGWW